jgi:hypothetical protein
VFNTRATAKRILQRIKEQQRGMSKEKRLKQAKLHCYRISVYATQSRTLSMKDAQTEMDALCDNKMPPILRTRMESEFMSLLTSELPDEVDDASVRPMRRRRLMSEVRNNNHQQSEEVVEVEQKVGVIDRQTSSQTRSVTDIDRRSVTTENRITRRPNGEVVESTLQTVSEQSDTKREESVAETQEHERYALNKVTIRKLYSEDTLEVLLANTDEYMYILPKYAKLFKDIQVMRTKPRRQESDIARVTFSRDLEEEGLRLLANFEPYVRPKKFPDRGFVDLPIAKMVRTLMPVQEHKLDHSFGIYGDSPHQVHVDHLDSPLLPIMMQIIMKSLYQDADHEFFHPSLVAMRLLRPAMAVMAPMKRMLLASIGVKIPSDAYGDDNFVQARIIKRIPFETSHVGLEPPPIKGLQQIYTDTFIVEYDLRRVPGLQELHASAKHYSSKNLEAYQKARSELEESKKQNVQKQPQPKARNNNKKSKKKNKKQMNKKKPLTEEEEEFMHLLEVIYTQEDIDNRDEIGIPSLQGRVKIGMSIGMAAIFDRFYLSKATYTAANNVDADMQFAHTAADGLKRIANGYVPSSQKVMPSYTALYLERVCHYSQEWSDDYLQGTRLFGDHRWMPHKNAQVYIPQFMQDMGTVVAAAQSSDVDGTVALPSLTMPLSLSSMQNKKSAAIYDMSGGVNESHILFAGKTICQNRKNFKNWLVGASDESMRKEEMNHRSRNVGGGGNKQTCLPKKLFGRDPNEWSGILDQLVGMNIKD